MSDLRLLSGIELFRDLGHEAVERIADICRVRKLKKGKILFWEGTVGDNLYIIREGTIKIFQTDPDGKTRTIKLMGPGEVIGEMALFESVSRSASAQAFTDTFLLEIGKADFTELLFQVPEIAVRLLAVLARRIRRMNSELESLSSLGVPERLSSSLKQLASERGVPVDDNWTKIELPLTHEELAQLIGSTRETVTRTLGSFEKKGWVRQKGRTFFVSKTW